MARRWLGKPHAIKVKKNPLHYTVKIEDTKQCIRCDRFLHKSAFKIRSVRQDAGVIDSNMCAECRNELFARFPR